MKHDFLTPIPLEYTLGVSLCALDTFTCITRNSNTVDIQGSNNSTQGLVFIHSTRLGECASGKRKLKNTHSIVCLVYCKSY